MFTVLFACVVFFSTCFVVVVICVEVDVDRMTMLPPPPPLLIVFPTHNSLFNASDSYLKSVRA